LIITEHDNPSPHIIVDDFLDNETLKSIKLEISEIRDKTTQGDILVGNEKVIDTSKKKNNNIWLDNLYSDDRNRSNILKYLPFNIWTNLKPFLMNSKSAIFRVYNKTNQDNTLLSIYKNNDFYGEHHDRSENNELLFLTTNLMLKMKGDFKGGEFVLQDKTIPFKDNRLVIFESHRIHSVNKVITDDNPDNWRYTLQYFAKIK